MRRIFVTLLTLLGCQSRQFNLGSDTKFNAKEARSGKLEFIGSARFNISKSWCEKPTFVSRPGAAIFKPEFKAVLKKAEAMANDQTHYIIGALKTQVIPDGPDYTEFPGNILRTPGSAKVTGATIIDQETCEIEASYAFSDTIVLHKHYFKPDIVGVDGKTKEDLSPIQLTFALPLRPETLVTKQIPAGKSDDCAGDEGASDGNLWYYFNPFNPKCTHLNMDNDILSVSAKVVPVASTTKTFPPYEKIFANTASGGRKTVKMVHLQSGSFHLEDLNKEVPGVFTTPALYQKALDKDEGFRVYREASATYTQMFGNPLWVTTALGDSIKVKAIFQKSFGTFDLVLKHEFHFPKGEKTRIQWASNPTEKFDFDGQFVQAVVDGINDADVFMYAGHSGLGINLIPWRIQEIIAAKRANGVLKTAQKPQIFLFDGCSSTSYYVTPYLKLKRDAMGRGANGKFKDPTGMKNLDILATTREDWFFNNALVAPNLIKNLISESRPSWQEIMKDLSSITEKREADGMARNGGRQELGDAFLHVIGDELSPE